MVVTRPATKTGRVWLVSPCGVAGHGAIVQQMAMRALKSARFGKGSPEVETEGGDGARSRRRHDSVRTGEDVNM